MKYIERALEKKLLEIVPFLHDLAGCSYLHWVWWALGRALDVV